MLLVKCVLLIETKQNTDMKKLIAYVAVLLSFALNIWAQEAVYPVVYKTLFTDKFSAKKMDDKKWNIPTWYSPTDGTYVGRTQFRCSQNSGLPKVRSGVAQIALDTYNPTGFSLYGTDLITEKSFGTTASGIRVTFVARAKGPFPKGMVIGLFLYSYNASTGLHDEVDFELLGNDTKRVCTNIYGNEPFGVGHPVSYLLSSGSATTWHKYQIFWSKHRVSWYVDGKLLRTVTTQFPIPTGPMYVHANVWAPDAGWEAAYDDGLQPVFSSRRNSTYYLLLDSVKVEAVK
jgi:beta-glucanase (GH16 family)